MGFFLYIKPLYSGLPFVQSFGMVVEVGFYGRMSMKKFGLVVLAIGASFFILFLGRARINEGYGPGVDVEALHGGEHGEGHGEDHGETEEHGDGHDAEIEDHLEGGEH